jgi:5'-methylthioadenosine phosphorylase
MEKAQIGIIGGSGLYQMEGLTDIREISVETPFGTPSDNFILGTLDGVRVAFLARHGRGHRITPTELNFRANIYAMKLLGAERIISASAVGSLQEQYAPTDIVIPDQFFDRTRGRASTFFGEGVVAHITSPIRFATLLAVYWPARAKASASRFIAAEHTFAWKVRRFRHWPNPDCIAVGEWM